MPTIQLPSAHIHYNEHGAGAPLILLHGLGGSAQDWSFNVPYLEDHRLLMLDIPEFGSSRIDGEYSIPALAMVISQTIQQLSLEKVSMVGFSFGGAIALELLAHPKKYAINVDQLILFSSQPSYQLNGLKQCAEYYFRVSLLKLFGLPTLANVIAKRLFPHPDQKPLRDYVEQGLQSNGTQSYLSAMRALTQWSIEDKLKTITQNILVVASENDYASLDSKGYVDRLPNANLSFIENCGHAIPLEKPQLAASLINQHLKL